MLTFHPVCTLAALKSARTIGYQIGEHEGFVVYGEADIMAYQNSCPHIGMNLEFTANKFLDADNKYIQCSMHGALFEINTGLCIHGPCLNQSLVSVVVKVESDNVLVGI